MNKLLVLMVVTILASYTADAQFKIKKKKKNVETEQEEDKPLGFEVNGFARDRDKRDVRYRGDADKTKEGFGNKEAKTRKQKPMVVDKNTGIARNRDIETLMADLNLAKIQKPVFRGILTEHLRDVTEIMAKEGIEPAERNTLLKQVYTLRNKRLQETLTEEQYLKWLRIKDEDEYLKLEKPEDY
jgi:hypothetical protein